jgi:hypothetical protein
VLPEWFALVGAAMASIGGLQYLYETLRGTARPNRVSWLLWGVLPGIVFVAQRIQGVESVSWVTFAAGLPPLLVVAASFFNPNAYWKTSPFDYACLVVALIGLGLWFATDDPNTAILLTIVADLAAGLPTVLKAFRYPATESWRAFALATTGFVVSLLAIHDWTFQNYAFVVYLLCIDGLITLLALDLPRRLRPLPG